jgi:hypothetical protein
MQTEHNIANVFVIPGNAKTLSTRAVTQYTTFLHAQHCNNTT